jgi:hypothetical protein
MVVLNSYGFFYANALKSVDIQSNLVTEGYGAVINFDLFMHVSRMRSFRDCMNEWS